jgi:PadR family transcriptional regulator PadR
MHETKDAKAEAVLRRGAMELCVLLAISQGKRIYASDIIKRLAGAGLSVIEGTLYPLLNRLRREGQLEYAWEESRTGPPRKYYSVTKKGREKMEEMRTGWESIHRTIKHLEDHA